MQLKLLPRVAVEEEDGAGRQTFVHLDAAGHSHSFTGFVLRRLRAGKQHQQSDLKGGQRNFPKIPDTGATPQLAR